MLKIFNTLYARLVLVLIVLFAVASVVFLLTALYSAHMYQQEVSQRLNRELAEYIVNEHVLIRQGKVQQDNLKQLFHEAMIINPTLELYLLDAQGKVLAYSDVLDDVKQDHVSLEPVNALLSGKEMMPIMGDDPRNTTRQQVFSAAPIMQNNSLQGYIYAVLGGERVEHITQLLQQSYILKWSLAAIAIVLLFSLLSGLLIFYLLTCKLRRLSNAMQRFSRQNHLSDAGNESVLVNDETDSDEIDRMTTTFNAMAERIQLQMKRLQETDALRRELVANVSHDLRTPLSSLTGYLETLKLKGEELDTEKRNDYINIAHVHAERLSKLVIELFELAKLDANELKPQKEIFSPAELAFDVSQKFLLRAQSDNIRLEIDADPSVPFVYADLGMIERVLDNLIDNAFRHTPAGGSVHIRIKTINDVVEISVVDTGYGISDENLPHIFKRFYRKAEPMVTGDKPCNSSSQGGAGLGLAIASRIIELHGSKLSVSTVLHQGTTFMFNLPVQPSSHHGVS